MSNINNFAQNSNFICGSSALNLVSVYCTSVSIPGMTLNNAYITNSSGSAINLGSDSIIYGSCQLSLIIDENYDVYFEFMDALFNAVNPVSGVFADRDFDFFININDSKGKHLFRVDFVNAKMAAIGDLNLSTTSEDTEVTLNITLTFDHYEITRENKTLSIQ